MTGPHKLSERRYEYNVDELNGATEAESVGSLGESIVLLPGLAENILANCEEPDILGRRIMKTDSFWGIDESMWASVYYPGNQYQTCVAKIVKIDDDDEELIDYYQIPYCEVIPRIQALMKSAQGTEYRWFIAQSNNVQFDLWAKESCVEQMSKQALRLLDGGEERREDETIRDKHVGVVESQKERAND